LITVVSGLPRSGTSLMMQMLDAGGMELFSDNIRQPDRSNPRGYCEFERVKSLNRDSSWLYETEKSAVKIVAHWLHFLPPEFEYSIVFMERELEEVIKSQDEMLKFAGRPARKYNLDLIANSYRRLIEVTKSWLSSQKNINTIYINHHEVITNPSHVAERINKFLGNILNDNQMPSVIDHALYHQKIK